LPKQGI